MANTRRVPVTVDHLLVTSDQTGMVKLSARSNLPDEMFDPVGTNKAKSDGTDIRIYSDAGVTEMRRSIVGFTYDSVLGAGDGACEIWLTLPTWVISSLTDTTYYLEYGDGTLSDYAVGDTFGRNAVWDGAQLAVLMESITPVDHTGNHTLSLSGTLTNLSGPFGTANAFAGNDRLSNNDAALRDIFTTYDVTVSSVIKRSSYAPSAPPCAWSGTDDLVIYPMDSSASDGLRVFWRDLGGNVIDDGPVETLANTWVWSSFTSRATNDHEGYTNGASIATNADTGTAGPFSDFHIGGWQSGTQDWDGDIAQLVVWKTARTTDRINAEHANQNSPSTFSSPGTPVAIGGGGEIPIFRRRIEGYA